MVDGGGSPRCALLGDMIAADLVKNGWEGLVMFSYVRDTAVVAGLNIGVKAHWPRPETVLKTGPRSD